MFQELGVFKFSLILRRSEVSRRIPKIECCRMSCMNIDKSATLLDFFYKCLIGSITVSTSKKKLVLDNVNGGASTGSMDISSIIW